MQATQVTKQSFLDKTFKLKENKTNIRTEVLAGTTTFMTMAYILVVNSNILADAGMDKGAAFTATAIGAFIGSCIMGILANYPVALAPGMGLNAFFAYTVVLSMGYSWQFALCAVFIEGIIFILMSVTNVREKILDCIPNVLKDSITAGIGLFIAFVGLANCGLVTNGATILQLGNLQDPLVLLTIFGLIAISILLAKNVKGAFLIGMLIVSAVGMAIGLVEVPNAVVSSVPSMKPVFLQALSIPFNQIFSFDMFMVVLTFLFMDLFTTVGCLVGVASKGNMLDEDGKLPRVKQALLSDSIATTVGALLGTSTVTSYVESAAGIGEGGRTGLTAVSTAFMFFLSLFLSPIFGVITSAVTASVLVIVGLFMIENIKELNLEDYTEAIPAFLTIIMMPFAYSISDGIVFGVVSYILLKLFTGRWKEISWTTVVVGIVFVLKFVFI